MREKFLVVPRVNTTELLRNLAIHGVNCLNLRICGSLELARIAFLRSGIFPEEEIISNKEVNILMAQAVKDESYFGETTFSDVQEIASAIRMMRNLVVEDEAKTISDILAKGTFREKNSALLNAYNKYMELLCKRNALDQIAYIKKAISECEKIDADFIVLKEYPLNLPELLLCHKLSGGAVNVCTLEQLYQLDKKSLKIENYLKCYGAPNEVETVLQSVYTENKADKSLVAITDVTTYSQLFFDYALLYNIPVTFGCGIPIVNSNPAKLLALYQHWMEDGYFSGDALKKMLQSEAFNNSALYKRIGEQSEEFKWVVFYKLLYQIRLTNQCSVNRERIEAIKTALEQERILALQDEKTTEDLKCKQACIPALEIVAEELALAPEEFISRYSYVRSDGKTNAEELLMKLDMAASAAIYDELKLISNSDIGENIGDIIQSIFKRNVCRQSNREGALHIAEMSSAWSCVRENVYVVGLSASKFPGSPKESYLLLDEDLKGFGEWAENYTSDGRIIEKKNKLKHFLRLASNLGSKISVSYAGFNVSDLKNDNASSILFELYQEENGTETTISELNSRIKPIAYFEPAISQTREIGKAYNAANTEIIRETVEVRECEPVRLSADCEYSPTALSEFFMCPRRFMLKRILGINEPEETNVFEVMSAAESGTLAHSLMERLGNEEITKEEFMNLAEEYFERFIMKKPPVVRASADYEKQQFMDMMDNAYNMRPRGEVLEQEMKLVFRHESGVILQGKIDCIERINNNSYRIVDYKTSKEISHIENDINTCLQIVIYAYLLESAGYRVVEGTYKYLRLERTVTCQYNDAMKRALREMLEEFKRCVENAEFNCTDNVGVCQNCSYKRICGRR